MNKDFRLNGKIAFEFAGKLLPVQVCGGANHLMNQHAPCYFIGTVHQGVKLSRESVEWYLTEGEADTAMKTDSWTQRHHH